MTRYLVAIDPGYAKSGQGCAVAVFRDGILLHAIFTRSDETHHSFALPGVVTVVWEIPQVDARSLRSAEAIVRLAGEGGVVAGRVAGANPGATIRAYEPRAWKGSTPKPVHHRRLWELLSGDERALVSAPRTPSEVLATIERAQLAGAKERWAKPGVRYYPANWHTHNLLDAVALGAFELGRIGP